MTFPGSGLVKGLAVTLLNFVGSYFDRHNRLITVEYPEQRIKLRDNYRNFPFLVYDAEPDSGIRCTACKICEKECPPQCIYIVMERDGKGAPLKRPAIFDIDVSVCMSCGICVEVCPFEAIKMDQVYELGHADRFLGLLKTKTDLLKSAQYHESIRPAEAREAREALAQAEAERRRKQQQAKPSPAEKGAPAAGTSPDRQPAPGPEPPPT